MKVHSIDFINVIKLEDIVLRELEIVPKRICVIISDLAKSLGRDAYFRLKV